MAKPGNSISGVVEKPHNNLLCEKSMTSQTPFQSRPGSETSISKSDVVDYLVEQKQRGYIIYEVEKYKDQFDLTLDDLHSIRFIVLEDKIQIQIRKYNNSENYHDVTSMFELRMAVDEFANNIIGPNWKQSPVKTRLSADTPLTNISTIAKLIGTSRIVAIFDPYFDNKSFKTLIDIVSLGNCEIDQKVRILTTKKTTSGKRPRLTDSAFEAWQSELGIAGKIRTMESSEHRRFILINKDESILLGPSLNSIEKNEAISREISQEDKLFFDKVWENADTLY